MDAGTFSASIGDRSVRPLCAGVRFIAALLFAFNVGAQIRIFTGLAGQTLYPAVCVNAGSVRFELVMDLHARTGRGMQRCAEAEAAAAAQAAVGRRAHGCLGVRRPQQRTVAWV